MTATDATLPVLLERDGPEKRSSATVNLTAFDRRQYQKLIQARGETIRKIVTQLKPALELANALDAGCGIGFFSQILHECGLYTRGFDGRMENIVEARKRFPRIPFAQGDIQDPDIVKCGKFDLVLCFGLLYHLENPMLAVRHLYALTGKGLLLESMCIPGNHVGMVLRDEPPQQDQSLTDIALCPSERCLVKMLYCAGFANVYRVATLPDHDDFRETPAHARRRTVLFASPNPTGGSDLETVAEPHDAGDPWSTGNGENSGTTVPARIRTFIRRPSREKYICLAQRARQVFPEMPIPLRLRYGAWWPGRKKRVRSRAHSQRF